MKKIWMILVMMCSVSAFTACSDDGEDPKSPVTVTEMEKMAYRGEDFLIKGTGFDPSAKFALKDEAGKETPLEIVGEVTATQVRLDIPTDLEAGKYTVVLIQAGSWELGKITLAGILDIVWPAELNVDKAMTIGGQGFDETVKVYLEAENGTRTEVQGVQVTENGIECQIPDEVLRNKLYVIVCIQDEKEYKSDGIILTITKRLKSIEWKHTESDYDEELGDFVDKEVSDLTELHYNDKGQLAQVITSGDVVNITYPNEKTIKALSEDEDWGEIDITFTLDGTAVRSCDLYDSELWDYATCDWNYLDNNYLQKIASKDESSATCDFTFQDGDLTKLELSVLNQTHSFEYGNQLAYGMDMAVWITAKGKDLLTYSFYLDLLGKKSLHLPIKYSDGVDDFDLEYELDEDGFVTQLTLPTPWGEPDVYKFTWE